MRWTSLMLLSAVAGGFVGPAPIARERRHPPLRCMPKGDGKQRRPKQQPKQQPPPPGAAPAPPPAPAPRAGRVNQENSLLKARTQIALARAFKQRLAAAPAKPAVRTSFRKKRDDGANRTATDGPEVEVDLDLGLRPLLFVDGYNVINAWPRLKKRFDKGDLASAREMLLDDVGDFAAGRFEVMVVFDAAGSAERVVGTDVLEEALGGLVQVVYASESADAYIEREVRRLRAEERRQVHVATSDGGIATAVSLHGATVLSSGRLISELKASRNSAAAVLEDFNRRQSLLAGRATSSIWDALDPSVRSGLDRSIEQAAQSRLSKRDREAMEAAKKAGSQLRKAAIPRPGANRARGGAGTRGTGSSSSSVGSSGLNEPQADGAPAPDAADSSRSDS